jgi:hypothetical protein
LAYPSRRQARALRALLSEIGYADARIARELPDGQLQLIDGHLRAETRPDVEVPVLVLDVSEEEADKLLLTLDPLAAMAETDAERVKALLETVRTDDEAVQELFKRTAGERLWRSYIRRKSTRQRLHPRGPTSSSKRSGAPKAARCGRSNSIASSAATARMKR